MSKKFEVIQSKHFIYIDKKSFLSIRKNVYPNPISHKRRKNGISFFIS